MRTPSFTLTTRVLLVFSFCGITILSLIPIQESFAVNIWDKAQHAGAYLYLSLLVWGASLPRRLTGRHALLLMVYGIGIEVLQAGLPWRSFSLLDMVANASGIAMGGAILQGMASLKNRK
ncbi:VanZ family protein [Desulfoluna sp.]|uniref:VanZ family protein n=1 Tax=Desulfoluna sp. TaxID=2045199 RepID=UPI002611E35B|nr:VanZ family protein [Desulfoluna sp.]